MLVCVLMLTVCVGLCSISIVGLLSSYLVSSIFCWLLLLYVFIDSVGVVGVMLSEVIVERNLLSC